jgi:hypothetical protein
MTDPYTSTKEALEALEQQQREQYAPKPAEPLTPAEQYAQHLNAARSPSVTVDAGWIVR